MTVRIVAIALLASALSTAAMAQGAGGAGGTGGGGAAGGAPGSAPSGTSGVSPSTSTPPVGTPGISGPTSGAGLPGGPGPGTTAVVPNLPAPPSSSPTVGSGGAGGNNTINSTSSGRGGSGSPRPAVAGANGQSAAAEFNPGAVIDQSLAVASQDITAMPTPELRALVAMFDACTIRQHPADRQGTCGAASKSYKRTFGKDRAIDRAIIELERIVRFQRMFRTNGPVTTEYEDNINKRLRGVAALALAADLQSRPVKLQRE